MLAHAQLTQGHTHMTTTRAKSKLNLERTGLFIPYRERSTLRAQRRQRIERNRLRRIVWHQTAKMDRISMAALEPTLAKYHPYYNRQGHPITLKWYCRYHCDMKYMRVARTRIDADAYVSTVWLGIDHGWGGESPIIFETMIFGGPFDEYQRRYHTEAEAIDGHWRVVVLARLGKDPADDDDTTDDADDKRVHLDRGAEETSGAGTAP